MAGGEVYLLIDGTNDLEYVGQTRRSVELRFKEHLRENTCIGRAMRAHGADMFVVAILKKCDTNEELDRWEKHFILSRGTKSPNGYNLTDGGNACTDFSPESLAKMSASRTGEKNSFFGKHHTPETRSRLSKLHTGKKMSAEACAKMSKVRKGRKPSAETCAKISAAHTGEKFTEERCLNISLAKRGTTPYKNLLAEIDKRRLSYTALAKLAGLSPQIISRKMRGKINFNAEEIGKLVEFFGLPAEYLLERDDGLSYITSKAELSARFSATRRHDSPYKNLLAEIDKRRLSYSELAKLAGLSLATVSAKMRGKIRFTARDKAKLVEFFGLPSEYLLARDDGLSPITSQSERSTKISLARREDSPYKNLLMEMDKRQLSYSELAKILGVTQPTVSHKMRGRYKFTARDKVKLAELFGLSAEYLFAT